MKPTEETQAKPVDRFILHARIKRLGIDQNYLAAKLNRHPSGITRAMQGENETILRRIDRHVTWLENRKQVTQNSPGSVAQS